MYWQTVRRLYDECLIIERTKDVDNRTFKYLIISDTAWNRCADPELIEWYKELAASIPSILAKNTADNLRNAIAKIQ